MVCHLFALARLVIHLQVTILTDINAHLRERQKEKRTQAGHCQQQGRDLSPDGPHCLAPTHETLIIESSWKPACTNEIPSQQCMSEKALERHCCKRKCDRQAAGLQQSIVVLSQHYSSTSSLSTSSHLPPGPAAPDVAHNRGSSRPISVSVSVVPGGLPIPTAPPPQCTSIICPDTRVIVRSFWWRRSQRGPMLRVWE